MWIVLAIGLAAVAMPGEAAAHQRSDHSGIWRITLTGEPNSDAAMASDHGTSHDRHGEHACLYLDGAHCSPPGTMGDDGRFFPISFGPSASSLDWQRPSDMAVAPPKRPPRVRS